MSTNVLRLSLFPCVSLFTVVGKSVFTRSAIGKHPLNNTREKRKASYILPYIRLGIAKSQRFSALTRNCWTLLFLEWITNGHCFET